MTLADSETINVGMLVVTILATLAAIAAAIINWQVYRSQTDPEVIAYVKNDESRPTLLQIVIENVGRGLARDVYFTLSEQIPHRAWGAEVGVPDGPGQKMQKGPLIDGIPSLGPGSERVITWGQYGGLRSVLGDHVVYVNCMYRRADGSACAPTLCVLEVRSFELNDAVDSDGARQTADEVEKLRKAVEKFAGKTHAVHVVDQPDATATNRTLPQREALITSPSSEPEPAAWSRYQAVTAQTASRMSCKGSKRARRRFSRCAGESSRRWRPRSRRRRSWRTTSRASSSSTGTTCRHRPTHT